MWPAKRIINACVAAIIVAFVITAGFSLYVIMQVGGGGGGTEVIKESVSPHGKYVATQLLWNGGATTDFHTSVRLRELDNKSHLTDKEKDYVFDTAGRYDLDLRWIDGNHLEIDYILNPLRKSSFWKVDRWQDVQVKIIERKLSPIADW